MRTTGFSGHARGSLRAMLREAYGAVDKRFLALEDENWREFDDFFFDHPAIADRCGFVTMEGDAPVGFVSWDPRGLPASVQVGHNCILPAYRGRGYGKWQMVEAVERITRLHPKEIIVSTGLTPAFLPARRMYEAAGFKAVRTFAQEHPLVPDVVEYRVRL